MHCCHDTGSSEHTALMIQARPGMLLSRWGTLHCAALLTLIHASSGWEYSMKESYSWEGCRLELC